MRIQLVPIGNSKGIRLPKAIIEQAKLTNELELEVNIGEIVLRSARRPRENWSADAEMCHADHQDHLPEWDLAVRDFEGEWS